MLDTTDATDDIIPGRGAFPTDLIGGFPTAVMQFTVEFDIGPVNWIAPVGGSFTDAGNWEDGASPADYSNAEFIIAPAFASRIVGPEEFELVDVLKLTLGSGEGTASLDMQGGAIRATDGDGLIVDTNGIVTGNGVLITEGLRNEGRIEGEGLILQTQTFIQDGVYSGGGRVTGDLDNRDDAEIRLGAGESLRADRIGNDGLIELTGAELEADELFLQDNRGRVIGEDATLRAETLSVLGELLFTGGENTISGDLEIVWVSGGTDPSRDVFGKIINSGNGTLRIFDDLTNNGELRTSGDGQTIILGDYTGAGVLTGTGTVFFEGDLKPGNSPALVLASGSIDLTSAGMTFMELGGTTIGTQYDAFDIGGVLTLGGDLDVSLVDAFVPRAGDRFTLFEADGGIVGAFSNIALAPLDDGLAWRAFRTDTTFGYAVAPIPLPAGVWGLLAALGVLGAVRGKTRA